MVDARAHRNSGRPRVWAILAGCPHRRAHLRGTPTAHRRTGKVEHTAFQIQAWCPWETAGSSAPVAFGIEPWNVLGLVKACGACG